jgi:lysophospholipase L1-like esterase
VTTDRTPGEGIRVVCAGDSITRGQLSVDYVDMLRGRATGHTTSYTRAGVNGDLAYNLVQRLDTVIAERPDVVTVLIGTNDARASLSDKMAGATVKRKKLPTGPTIDWYRENLTVIVKRLRRETHSRIALLSLPVLGQELDSAPVASAARYSQVVKETAAATGVAYLPLYERQLEHLRTTKVGQPTVDFGDGMGLVYRSVAQRILLGRTFDRIAERRKLELTTDFVHQNSRGAAMIADMIEQFVASARTVNAARC